MITFDELRDMLRGKLKITAAALAENALKALWCTLDVDDSNELEMSEFKHFIKRGEMDHSRDTKWGGQSGSYAKGGTFSFTSAFAIASQPTKEMRVELEEAGVAMPVDDELTAISKTINEGIENMRTISGEKSQSALSWHNLFRAVDADGAPSRSLDACPSARMKAPSRSSVHEVHGSRRACCWLT